MGGPALRVEIAEPDLLRPAPIEEARLAPREARRLDRIVEGAAELEDSGVGAILLHGLHNAAIGEPMHSTPATEWEDRYWTSRDALRLHFRDYAGPSDRPPILCLHGLTRNARDFEEVAPRYAGEWRVIVPDFRGRGESGWDLVAERYAPPIYTADILQLLDELGIARAIFLGTSLGGLVTMGMAAISPQRIAAALLNDVGPELETRGLDRIRTYVGKPVHYPSWEAAAQSLASANADRHPLYGPAEWLRFTRRLCRETDAGIVPDYDMGVGRNIHAAAEAPAVDAWPFFHALSGAPLLILRGEASDLLSADVAKAMADAHPDAELVTVPDVGHAPDLSEPQSVAAIGRLLQRALSA